MLPQFEVCAPSHGLRRPGPGAGGGGRELKDQCRGETHTRRVFDLVL